MNGQSTKARYRVVGLLVLLFAITYLDRVCLSVAAPAMQADLGLSQVQFAWVFTVFYIAYTVFEIPTSSLGDRWGQRLMLVRIVGCWSMFTIFTFRPEFVPPWKADDGAVFGLGHKPIIRGHLVVFLSARHTPGSVQRHLIAQTGQVTNDPVIFLLCVWIESNGFAAGGEALAAEFGNVKTSLELWNRMQTVLLDQFEQTSLRRTYPHATGIDGAASELCGFDAAADAIPGFEHDDLLALAAERSSRAQPGETCTNNHNFGLSGRALVGDLG